jgi:signal transduction histidine kinase
MKPPQTLRSRITFYFCGYMAVLLVIYSAAMFIMLHESQDLAFNRQLAQIADRIVGHIDTHGHIPTDLPMYVTAYSKLANVPETLRPSVANRGPGVFELAPTSLDYHAALVNIPSTGQMLYVFFNVASMELSDRLDLFMALALVGAGLGVLFLGWILARSLSNRILDPISELAGTVQALAPDEKATELRAFTASDEVGTLARTIDQLLKRISAFSRREREFTAHASHELRTPATVIKGAVEILKRRSGEQDARISRPLARIDRAVTDIERLIDTFLVLARQGKSPEKEEACDVRAIAEQAADAYAYLLEDKPVEIMVRAKDPAVVKAPPSLLTIALGNLVRNAFQYTLQGRVDIIVGADRVSIIDSGQGVDASRKGTGLGLTIVERICETMNWQFALAGEPDRGTRAELIFR